MKEEGIKLINDDCLNALKNIPDNSVDMILTDPPYGINFKSNRRKERYDKIKNDDNLEWIEDFINELFRISKDNTAHYLFCSFHNVDIFKKEIEKKFKIKNILIWKKTITGWVI